MRQPIEHNHAQDILLHQDCPRCRLNAVAPELLKATIRALEIIEGEYPADDEIAAPVMAELRAAIAKATL
jgi:hypothetical protein